MLPQTELICSLLFVFLLTALLMLSFITACPIQLSAVVMQGPATSYSFLCLLLHLAQNLYIRIFRCVCQFESHSRWQTTRHALALLDTYKYGLYMEGYLPAQCSWDTWNLVTSIRFTWFTYIFLTTLLFGPL